MGPPITRIAKTDDVGTKQNRKMVTSLEDDGDENLMTESAVSVKATTPTIVSTVTVIIATRIL